MPSNLQGETVLNIVKEQEMERILQSFTNPFILQEQKLMSILQHHFMILQSSGTMKLTIIGALKLESLELVQKLGTIPRWFGKTQKELVLPQQFLKMGQFTLLLDIIRQEII